MQDYIVCHFPIYLVGNRQNRMAFRRAARRRAPVRRRRPSTPTRRRRAPTRTPRGRRVAPASMRNPRQTRQMEPGEKFLFAQIDPFSPECWGAKIPDSNTVPSVASQDVENVSLALTTATNMRAWAFNPSYVTGQITSNEAAAQWVWPLAFAGGSNRTKYTSYSGQFELNRPTAHAVRISSPVAPLNATGFVHIAIAYESYYAATTWPWPTTPGGLSGYQYYKRVTLASLTQSPLTIVNKYVDDTAFRYLSTDASDIKQGNDLEFAVPHSWGTILIAVEGVGSTSPLSIEHLLMTEAIPKSTSSMNGSTAAQFRPEILQQTSNMSSHTDFAHTEQGQGEYVAAALHQVRAGVSSAGQHLFDNVVLPYAHSIGQSAVASAVSGFQQAVGIGGVNSNPNRLVANV